MLWVLLSGCVGSSFDPPDLPAHDDLESEEWEGSGSSLLLVGWHADDKDSPFLCRDPDSGKRVTCPEERPAQENLSCDAAGCHGDFTYAPGADQSARHLRGSDGPSCYFCHNQKWSSRKD